MYAARVVFDGFPGNQLGAYNPTKTRFNTRSTKAKWRNVISLCGTNSISYVDSSSIVIIQHAAVAVNVEGPFEFAPDQHGDVQLGLAVNVMLILTDPVVWHCGDCRQWRWERY